MMDALGTALYQLLDSSLVLKAGAVAFAVFFVAVNLIAKSSGGVPMEISYVFYASTLQWLYDLVLAVWIATVLVLRRVM